MNNFDDTEPRSLNESHSKVQPRWVRFLTVVIGIPVIVAWAYLIQSGKIFEHQDIALALFGAFGVIALLQLFFVARAYWRMDI